MAPTSNLPINSDEATYTDDDLQFLLKMVQEYTLNLRVQYEKVDRFQIQFVLTIASMGGGMMFGALLATQTHNLSQLNDWGKALLIMSTLIIFVFLMVIVEIYVKRFRRAKSEVKRLSTIVAQLLRRASQIRDRGLYPFSQRILIDIRLADAEFALEQVSRLGYSSSRSVVESTSNIISEVAESIGSSILMIVRSIGRFSRGL